MLVTRPLSNSDRVTAVCLATDAVGDMVYISGSKSGADYLVQKADPSDYSKMPAFGAIVLKITSTRCVVQLRGDATGLYTGLTPGRVCWVGLDGRPTQTPPSAGIGQKAYLQPIGLASATNLLYLRVEDDMKVRVG